MCDQCAPPQGWSRRSFLRAGGGVVLGMGLAGSLPAGASAGVGTPPILPRREWAGDLAPVGTISPEADVRFLLVHHTVNANDYAAGDVIDLLRGMYRFHTGPEKRWPDVAYNFVVDRFGRIWEARAGSLEGAVAGDATGGNQGFDQKCAFLGDHRVAPPSDEAQQAMVALLAHLADRHRIDTVPGSTTSFVSRGSNRFPEGTEVRTPTITGHRTMSFTECPGDAVMALVTDEFPAAVTARRTPATTTTGPTTAPASTTPTSSPSTTIAPEVDTPDDQASGPRASGTSPADEPVAWFVAGGVAALVVGALLRLRARRSG